MAELIEWSASGVTLRLFVDDERFVTLLAVGVTDRMPADLPHDRAINPVEVQCAGNRLPQGSRHVGLGGTAALRYLGHEDVVEGDGRSLILRQHDEHSGLGVSTRFGIRTDVPVITIVTTATNEGRHTVTLEYLSSFAYAGFHDADDIWLPHNTFFGEYQWSRRRVADAGIRDLGLASLGPHSSRKRLAVTNVGSQPTIEFLPMGAVHDRAADVTHAWQIEHNGSWHWEMGDHIGSLYLTAGGPNDQEHQWSHRLAPGQAFTSVPVAVAVVPGGLGDALAALTSHRRRIRRANADDVDLPVVFNDYMNGIEADPTEQKLLPVIAAAARVGSEVYCVDAGWYSDASGWWSTVGEWQESAERFPRGFARVFDAIREQGMVPGLWIEPEVMGVDSAVVGDLPAEAYFHHNGARVDAAGRHQLDFRHPAVIERMNAVIDRLVADYGLGYLKFDYNVNAGIGTDVGGISAGDGLLGHNRAYLAWIDSLFLRHPDLTIEACASGGARVDYATLARHSIASTSDQTDHLRSVAIAAAAPSAITPEQAAIWVYPQRDFSPKEFDVSIVNGLLARPQLSGRIWQLSDEQLDRLAGAVATYKGYRSLIPTAVPFWPLGLPGWNDEWVATGLDAGAVRFVSVWRRGGSDTVELPMSDVGARVVSVVFPTDAGVEASLAGDRLRVMIPSLPGAVVLRIDAV